MKKVVLAIIVLLMTTIIIACRPTKDNFKTYTHDEFVENDILLEKKFVTPIITATPTPIPTQTPIAISQKATVPKKITPTVTPIPKPKTVTGTLVIHIDKINIHLAVLYGTQNIDKTPFLLTYFSSSYNYSSPYPSGTGENVVIGAHRIKSMFYYIDKLENGDTIRLDYKGKQYIYSVYSKHVVHMSYWDYLVDPKGFSTLSLFSCDPANVVNTQYRLIVRSKLIEVK